MKTTFFITLLSVLTIALLATYMVKKEQRSMNRLSSKFIRLLERFNSWQMMR
jgi:flagellar biogenesis protein FliO